MTCGCVSPITRGMIDASRLNNPLCVPTQRITEVIVSGMEVYIPRTFYIILPKKRPGAITFVLELLKMERELKK